MARIRTIKPEFFTSEDIVALTPLARLLYVALWCEADKEGRLAWKPKTFKMRYFPGDNCDIDAMCAALVDGGLVRLYGAGLAYMPSFTKHQHVNPRESASELPAPDGVKDAGPKKVGKTLREAVFERDGYKCVRCGSDDQLQADHILPQSAGGPHVIENLRALCKSCNAGRPVSGKALDADLEKDGHTVASLRVRFGIDASIPDLHAQGGREGKGREGDSEANASDAAASLSKPEDSKAELWLESIVVLTAGGCPDSLCRSFMGKLVKDYGEPTVREAVTAAISAQPADAREYLKATCQRLKGDRRDPITTPCTDKRADEFSAAMDERAATATKPPAALVALVRRQSQGEAA